MTKHKRSIANTIALLALKWVSTGIIGLSMTFIALLMNSSLAIGVEPHHFAIDHSPLIIQQAKRQIQFEVEIAHTAAERETGLMYRNNFPAKRAMLFVFDKPQNVQMWMANTALALDMLFLDQSGKIIYIENDTHPYSLKVISANYPTSFVIELIAGVARDQRIQIGQNVYHPAICGSCGGLYQ